MPTADTDLRRLGRALGHRSDAAKAVVAQWQQQAREVRRIHERLFYRPLLAAVGQAQLDRRAARRPRPPGNGSQRSASATRRRDAPPRGAHRRGQPAGGHPAHPAAGHARLVRRRGRPRRRAARVPQGERGAGLHPLVPPAAARRGLGRRTTRAHPGPQPVCRGPARRCAGVGRDARGRGRADPAVARGPRPPDDARRRVGRTTPTRRSRAAREHPAAGAVPDRRGRPRGRASTSPGVGRALTDLTAALVETALAGGRPGRSRSRHGPLLDPPPGRRDGPPRRRRDRLRLATPTCCSSTSPLDGCRTRRPAQEQALRDACRSCAGCSAPPGPDPQLGLDADLRPEGKSGPLVRSLAQLPRLLRALVAHLGVPGPAAGDAAGRRPRAGRGGSSTLIDPLRWPADGLTDAAGPGDPDPQGPDGGRAAAPRRRPQEPLQAGPRWAVRRRVDGAAAPDAARPRRPGAAHDQHAARAGRRRGGRADRRRPRRGPAGRLVLRLPAAQRLRALPRPAGRQRAVRPAGRRRRQPHPRRGARQRCGSCRGLPPSRPAMRVP